MRPLWREWNAKNKTGRNVTTWRRFSAAFIVFYFLWPCTIFSVLNDLFGMKRFFLSVHPPQEPIHRLQCWCGLDTIYLLEPLNDLKIKYSIGQYSSNKANTPKKKWRKTEMVWVRYIQRGLDISLYTDRHLLYFLKNPNYGYFLKSSLLVNLRTFCFLLLIYRRNTEEPDCHIIKICWNVQVNELQVIFLYERQIIN